MLSTTRRNEGCALSPDPKSAPKTGSEVISPPEQDCQNLTVTAAGKRRAEKLPINHWLLEPVQSPLLSCLSLTPPSVLVLLLFALLDLIVLNTCVLCRLQWLFIVHVLDNCDNALIV